MDLTLTKEETTMVNHVMQVGIARASKEEDDEEYLRIVNAYLQECLPDRFILNKVSLKENRLLDIDYSVKN